MTPRHRVFVSFHSEDVAYARMFEQMFEPNTIISTAVQDGDIGSGLNTETVRQRIRDEFLRDSTVTVVLVGEQTWQRKHVDWEISSTLRATAMNPRGGLVGLLLPAYPSFHKNTYNKFTIPPRLADNVECGYAKLYLWSDKSGDVSTWIHDAFNRRVVVNPDNSRAMFAANRSGERWFD